MGIVFAIIGVVVLAITIGLVAWAAMLRRAYSGPNTAVFARTPYVFTMSGVAIAVCLALFGLSADTNIEAWAIVLAMCAFVLGLMYFFLTFRFWVANDLGLTTQFFLAKRTLPWHEIDWIYPSRTRITTRAYGVVPVNRSEREALIVQAGSPKRAITIPGRDTYFRLSGAPRAFTRTVEQSATNALFGYDKAPMVQQRRAMLALVATR